MPLRRLKPQRRNFLRCRWLRNPIMHSPLGQRPFRPKLGFSLQCNMGNPFQSNRAGNPSIRIKPIPITDQCNRQLNLQPISMPSK